jgi:Protein of unknown function (DUF3616)
MPDTPKSSPILRLDPTLSKKELAKIRDNFSAVVLHGSQLWLGGDEGTSLDRMTRDAVGNFGSHTRFDLAPLLRLPGGGAEIDIEGLDVDGGYLWLIYGLDVEGLAVSGRCSLVSEDRFCVAGPWSSNSR